MRTAVDGIFVGKERAYNRHFQAMCSLISSFAEMLKGDWLFVAPKCVPRSMAAFL